MDALEPVANHVRRARLRAKVRRLIQEQRNTPPWLFRELGCDPASVGMAIRQGTFGAAWEIIEGMAAGLTRLRVPVAALADETRKAQRIVADLRGSGAAHAAKRGHVRDQGVIAPPAPVASEMFRMAG